MADPTGYDVSYSFGGFQANSPTTPLPGASLDNELAGIAAATASLVAAIKDVRRADGALKNGLVTRDSLELALQLSLASGSADVTAEAIAAAEAAAASADADRVAAAASAVAAAISAAAAAASAASVDLTDYLAKANNLAGLGSNDTALSNLGAAKADGSTLTGRLAPTTGYNITDWNSAVTSGWFAGTNAANGPAVGQWLGQVIVQDTNWVTQIAYPFALASLGTSAVTPYRRHSYDSANVRVWSAWQSDGGVPAGSVVWFPSTTAPAGFLKANGALVSRLVTPELYGFAVSSGNIVSEATWAAGNSGAFSTGDLSTTFRLPRLNGEFIRSYDDSAGIDAGRVIGSNQADSLKNHTHTLGSYSHFSTQQGSGATIDSLLNSGGTALSNPTDGPSTGAATETRPRNVALLACIKY